MIFFLRKKVAKKSEVSNCFMWKSYMVVWSVCVFISFLSIWVLDLTCIERRSDHNQWDQINCNKFHIQLNWPKWSRMQKSIKKKRTEVRARRSKQKMKLERTAVTNTCMNIACLYRSCGSKNTVQITIICPSNGSAMKYYIRKHTPSHTDRHTHEHADQSHTPVGGTVALNEIAAKNSVMDYFDTMSHRLAG